MGSNVEEKDVEEREGKRKGRETRGRKRGGLAGGDALRDETKGGGDGKGEGWGGLRVHFAYNLLALDIPEVMLYRSCRLRASPFLAAAPAFSSSLLSLSLSHSCERASAGAAFANRPRPIEQRGFLRVLLVSLLFPSHLLLLFFPLCFFLFCLYSSEPS